MPKGISVYHGLNYTIQENMDYIAYAQKCGFSIVFSSLHIPEADYKRVVDEFKIMTEFANTLNMKVIADISPRTFKYLGIDMNNLQSLKEFGLFGIRVDFGFTAAEIAEFTRNPFGLKIEINASTVTEKFLDELENCGAVNHANFQACHNYYPRLNTGISRETFERKNKLLKKYPIHISAFIPSAQNKRPPICEGLPTMEIHRLLAPQVAAKHLFALGIDNVIFGDSIPSNEEISSVGCLDESVVELRVESSMPCAVEKEILFNCIHVNRPDCAEDVIRSTASREKLRAGETILPHDNLERQAGYVTIDNMDYLRYCGEVQICRKPLPADRRVNVVGKVIPEELFLMDYIGEETKFRLINKE